LEVVRAPAVAVVLLAALTFVVVAGAVLLGGPATDGVASRVGVVLLLHAPRATTTPRRRAERVTAGGHLRKSLITR
jgi:hypothetical protein